MNNHVTVSDLVASVRRQQPLHTVAAAPAAVAWPSRSVSIIGAHPGAGATSVAVAITDSLAARGHHVTLIDRAMTPDAFSCVEVLVDGGSAGGRAGRRGTARIVRFDLAPTAPGCDSDIAVVDGQHGGDRTVVVCRATLPSVGKASGLLADEALLAVVGASRWPEMVAASLSPAAARVVEEGRVAFLPHHRDAQVRGPDSEPTPSSVLAAAARLTSLLWPDLVMTTPRNRWKARR